jgi:hypothetical protein
MHGCLVRFNVAEYRFIQPVRPNTRKGKKKGPADQLCPRIESPVPSRKPVDEQYFFLMVSSKWASFWLNFAGRLLASNRPRIFIFSQTNKLRNLRTDRDSNGIMSRSFLTVAE